MFHHCLCHSVTLSVFSSVFIAKLHFIYKVFIVKLMCTDEFRVARAHANCARCTFTVIVVYLKVKKMYLSVVDGEDAGQIYRVIDFCCVVDCCRPTST